MARLTIALISELAGRFGVDAIGRELPTHHTRSGGYRYTKPGRWYVMVNGERMAATAAQSRALNRLDAFGYSSVGPIDRCS